MYTPHVLGPHLRTGSAPEVEAVLALAPPMIRALEAAHAAMADEMAAGLAEALREWCLAWEDRRAVGPETETALRDESVRA